VNAGGPRLPSFLREYPAAVVEVSLEGRVLTSNGWLEEELRVDLVGRDFADLLDPSSSLDKWRRMLEAAPGSTAVWELVLAGRDRLPEPRAFSALPDPAARTLWLLEHPRDLRLDRLVHEVTAVNSELTSAQRALSQEKRRLALALEALEVRQEELARINRELDEFAHVVSHDLQAPLRSIRYFAEFLEQDLGAALQGESAEYLGRLRKAVEDMQGLIVGVLDYARAGREGRPPEAVDVGGLVRDLLDILRPPPDAEISVAEDLPVLHTDRRALRQVFQNLIANAVRHGGGHRLRLRIDWEQRGDAFEFMVADNGPGIDPGVRERIWTLFFTTTASSDESGTGIGLPIVKKIVEQRGGSVKLESRPGEGARFIFLWPESPSFEGARAAAATA
jgi:signal transduction histidine kinase